MHLYPFHQSFDVVGLSIIGVSILSRVASPADSTKSGRLRLARPVCIVLMSERVYLGFTSYVDGYHSIQLSISTLVNWLIGAASALLCSKYAPLSIKTPLSK